MVIGSSGGREGLLADEAAGDVEGRGNVLGKQRQIQVAPGVLRLFVPQKVGGKGGAAHQKIGAGTNAHVG